MTVDAPFGDWPLFAPDGVITCPRCYSANLTDTGEQLSPETLSSMRVGSAPNLYNCTDCGNRFLPVDAQAHPMLTD